VCHSLAAFYIFFRPRNCYDGTLLFSPINNADITLCSWIRIPTTEPLCRCEWIDLPLASEPFIGLHVL
jgi:hypothetical protein